MRKGNVIIICFLLAGLLIAGCDGMFGDVEDIRQEAFEKNSEGGTSYAISFNIVGKEGTDSIAAIPNTGKHGAAIKLDYNIDNANVFNIIDFSGVKTPPARIIGAGQGSTIYIADAGDAINGVITISVTFRHIDRYPDTIAFELNGPISKTYGDVPFTNAINNTGEGSGAISYASDDTSIADVNSSSGQVTIQKAGTVTITATKAQDATYTQATAKYTLTIAVASPGAPNPPRGGNIGQSSVILLAPTGVDLSLFTLEYARNDINSVPSTGWQDSLTFSGLASDATYWFFARYKFVAEKHNASSASTGLSQTTTTTTLLQDTIAFTNSSMTKSYGDTAFTNTLGNAGLGSGAVSYESSDMSVATVNSSGLITILKANPAFPITITARKASDGTYAAAATSFTLTVSRKNVTITGLTVQSKVYNGDAIATINPGTGSISGRVGSDDVTITYGNANFNNKNAGTGKTVTFGNFSLGGSLSGNYNLQSQPANLTTGVITALQVSITGLTANNRAYDGTDIATINAGSATIVGRISPDAVTINPGTGAFNDKNVANNKTVAISGVTLGGTDAPNYQLTSFTTSALANITAKSITLTVGTPLAILSPIPVNRSTTFTVHSDGIVTGDTVTVNLASNSQGLSVSNNTGVSNVTSKTVTLTYDGTTVVTITAAISLALSISGNSNYTLTGDNNVGVFVRDGNTNATGRRIPVNQSNYSSFNTFANTADGLIKHYTLTENIVLPPVTGTASNWTAIGTNENRFRGSLDGWGYSITGLNINRSTVSYQGLFGYIISEVGSQNIPGGGVVERVGLIDCVINGNQYVGGVVGHNSGTVRNCFVRGSTTSHRVYASSTGSSYVGGITGSVPGLSTVENCYTNIAVEGAGDYVGGIAGYTYRGTIRYCYARGTVKGSSYTGGIVGQASVQSLPSAGAVRSCVALNPSITANNSSVTNIGRVFGEGNGTTQYSLNYARMDLQFIGVTYSPTSNSAGKDGQTIAAGTGDTQYNSKYFWETTVGFSFLLVQNGGGWQMSGTGNSAYPTLYGLQGQ